MDTEKGFFYKLNGHKTSVLSSIGGALLMAFIAGGGWTTLKADIMQVNQKVKTIDQERENYVKRRELNLTLEPLKQNIESIKNSLDEIKTEQQKQNQEILSELRRLKQDG